MGFKGLTSYKHTKPHHITFIAELEFYAVSSLLCSPTTKVNLSVSVEPNRAQLTSAACGGTFTIAGGVF